MSINLKSLAQQYPPLSKEQERILLETMIKGDDEESRQEAKTQLFFHHAAFILSVLNKFNIASPSQREEAELAAIEGFVRSLNKFDLKYDNRLATYAYYRIFLEVWDCIINNITAHFIPKHVYKEINRFIKTHEGSSNEEIIVFICNKLKVDEETAVQVMQITRTGISNFSDLILPDDTGDASSNLVESLESVTGDSEGSGSYAKLELSRIADDLDDYSKEHLTVTQNRVIQAIILPYLREQRIVTIADASDQLMMKYQSIYQVFDYAKIKMLNSNKGKSFVWVINEVLKKVKGHRRPRKNVKPSNHP